MLTKTSKFKLFSYLLIIILLITLIILSIININKYTTNTINYYDENINKVVEIAAYDEIDNKSYGTGWFIDDNTIITNYHVLSYLEHEERILFDTIEIRFYDTDVFEQVELIKYDEIKDIAVIKYNGNHVHDCFKQDLTYHTTDRCYSIGNFSNYGLSYKEGYISLKDVKLSYNNEYHSFIQCSITIGQGDSGAPLFNSNNEVIGMITFRTKNNSGYVEEGFAYAIPLYRILEEYNK